MNSQPDMSFDAERAMAGPGPEGLLDLLIAAALPMTGAVACAFDVPADVLAPHAVRRAEPRSGALGDCLDLIARARAPGIADDIAERQLGGTRYRFERLVLCAPGGLVLGRLTLGFDIGAGAQGPGHEMTGQFGALAAGMLCERRGQLALAHEVTRLDRHAAELQTRLRKDPLTGLENAPSFGAVARDDLACRGGAQALILFDVDHFKDINDLYGHQFGDTYLRAVAEALCQSLPAQAHLGRIGGDEFAALIRLPTDPEPALGRALEHCRDALQKVGARLGIPELGSVSLGAALFPRQAEHYDALFELADTALYAAKQGGRGAAVLFDERRHLRFSLRELMRDFSGALAAGEVRPVFHPVVDLATGICAGYEVLARWQAPGCGTVGPELFSPIFESPVLAQQLTRSMIGQATQWLSRLPERSRASGEPLRIGINVTAFDLCNQEFADDLDRLLQDFDLSWAALVIEVPETVMLGETGGNVFEALRDLRARGAKIALDDFGTGYGSLQHLGTWPIDILKIDCQFVQGLSARPRDRAVVDAILGMARRFGFRVVAEGIETPGQLSYLRAMGCDAGQGHLISPPLTSEALAQAPAIYPLGGVDP